MREHTPECRWKRTTEAECAYRATHYYCPHPEHACDCTVTREGLCMKCGREYPVWSAENELWNRHIRNADGSERWAFLCAHCFMLIAADHGEGALYVSTYDTYLQRLLLLQLLGSLTLCDHMGDVSNNIVTVLERLGIEYDDMDEWPEGVQKALHARGVTTLHGSSLEMDE